MSQGFRQLLSRRWLSTGVCAALAAAATMPASASAAAGVPDTSFGGSGSELTATNTRLFATAVQSDGDVVAVGESGVGGNPKVLIERFTPSGALDPSFGAGGIVNGPAVSGAAGSIARAVAIEPDGKIVVVGDAVATDDGGNEGLLVERFDSNGSLDTSFGAGGVENLLGGSFAAGNAVAIQSNGDILAGGSEDLSAVPYATVVRLTSTGTPDSSFGSGGVDALNVGAYSVIQALAIQSNGAILAAGSASPDLQATDGLLVRLTTSGSLDTSFNGTGAVLRQFAPDGGAYSSLNGVAIDASGNIYAAGASTADDETADAFVVRYSSSGSADSAFGSGGVAYTGAAHQWIQIENTLVPGAYGLTITPNGDLIAGGTYDDTTSLTYGALWAFTPTGTLDSTFGTKGATALQPTNKANAEFAGLALSPTTGDIVAAGDAEPVGGSYSGLVASVTGYGAPKTVTPPPTKTTALKLTVTGVAAKYSAKQVGRDGIRLSATCNQACSLKLTLTASAATAKGLHITTRVRSCRTVKGKRKCSYTHKYEALTVSASAKLSKAGTHKFTVKLSKALITALRKHPNSKWKLSVTAKATATGKSKSSTKTVEFTK